MILIEDGEGLLLRLLLLIGLPEVRPTSIIHDRPTYLLLLLLLKLLYILLVIH